MAEMVQVRGEVVGASSRRACPLHHPHLHQGVGVRHRLHIRMKLQIVRQIHKGINYS